MICRAHSLSVSMCDGIEMAHGCEEKRAIGCSRGGANLVTEICLMQELFIARGGEDVELSLASAEVHFAIGHHWRRPDFAFDIVRPKRRAGVCVDAVHFTSAIGN